MWFTAWFWKRPKTNALVGLSEGDFVYERTQRDPSWGEKHDDAGSYARMLLNETWTDGSGNLERDSQPALTNVIYPGFAFYYESSLVGRFLIEEPRKLDA